MHRQNRYRYRAMPADTVCSGSAAQVYLKPFRSGEGKLGALGGTTGAKRPLLCDMREDGLYKPQLFEWNGTLPSKQRMALSGSHGSARKSSSGERVRKVS